jgi:hypothetical protein
MSVVARGLRSHTPSASGVGEGTTSTEMGVAGDFPRDHHGSLAGARTDPLEQCAKAAPSLMGCRQRAAGAVEREAVAACGNFLHGAVGENARPRRIEEQYAGCEAIDRRLQAGGLGLEADDGAAQLQSAGDVRHQPLESDDLIIVEWRAIGAAVDADQGRPRIVRDQVATERLDQPERVVEFFDEARAMVLVAEEAPRR